jgi:hypothetical protein
MLPQTVENNKFTSSDQFGLIERQTTREQTSKLKKK